MLFLMLMTTLMLMLMLTSVCDEEGEDDEVVLDIDDHVDVDVHVRVDVDVDVDVYELFDNCIVTGWITNPSLRITLCLSWKKDRMEGRFIKLCIAKTKLPIFIFMYFTKEVKGVTSGRWARTRTPRRSIFSPDWRNCSASKNSR